MVPAVRPLGPLSMARGCARIDSRPDTAKIGSVDRVEVHHARLLAVIGVRKTFPHGLGQNRKSSMRANVVRFAPESGHFATESACPFRADSVAKVFLRHGSQILRGAGAAIEQRCGGPRRHTPNSQAILAAGLRLYRAAIVACFVLWREFSSCGFRDFCNTIGTKLT
jgi:hypothetical protein